MVERAHALLISGDEAGATNRLTAMLVETPAQAPALQLLSVASGRKAGDTVARCLLRRALVVDPMRADAWRWLADLENDAVQPIRRSMLLEPMSQSSLDRTVEKLEGDDARWRRRLRIADPKDVVHAGRLARHLFDTGRLTEAETVARRGLEDVGDAAIPDLAVLLAVRLAAYAGAWLEREAADLGSDHRDAGRKVNQAQGARFDAEIADSELMRRNTAPPQMACPLCGEAERLIERNRVYLTMGFELYFDFTDLAQKVFEIDDPGPSEYAAIRGMLMAHVREHRGEHFVRLSECEACGAVYPSFPFSAEAVRRYYEVEARAFRISGRPMYSRAHEYDWVREKTNMALYLRDRLGGSLAGKSVLDVASAEGIVCSYLRDLGADVAGVEPNERCCAYARQALDLRIHQGAYDEAAFPGERFDAIISNHTLEHALDPKEFLARLYGHLKPGGHLLLQLPCADVENSTEIQSTGEFHVFGFRRKFLERLVIEAGFEILESRHFFHKEEVDSAEWDDEVGRAIWGETAGGISLFCRRASL